MSTVTILLLIAAFAGVLYYSVRELTDINL